MEKDTIPRQDKGAGFDVREIRTIANRDKAVARYLIARERLLNVSGWGTYADEMPNGFILTDHLGNEVQRAAIEGDHVKIHLPGPRNTQGDGADWVIVEKIQEERNKMLDEIFTAMTLRPCPDPRLNKKDIAHFYEDRSTNTLMVCRHKTELICSIHGRNEVVNTDTNWLDIFRNLLVALPAKAGLSNPHWKKLAKGLIDVGDHSDEINK